MLYNLKFTQDNNYYQKEKEKNAQLGLVETNYKPSRTRSPPLPILCVLIHKSRGGVGGRSTT